MQTDTKTFAVDDDSVRENVLSIVATASAKITPSELEKIIFAKYRLGKKQIKTVIRNLVSGGELAYTYRYGCTFLERSFAKPVRISTHVVLKPPGHYYRSKSGDVVIQIKPGASFGAGRHPSTRLAIKGIEFAFLSDQAVDGRRINAVLDIGTGSGVLVITAVLCGMDRGLGIDIDPCARVEAAENVKINGLEDRIVISGQSLATLDQRFTLVTANLRYPSLKKLLNRLTEITDKEAIIILSGIKNDEMADLLEVYTKKYFKWLWTADELSWACVVMQKLA